MTRALFACALWLGSACGSQAPDASPTQVAEPTRTPSVAAPQIAPALPPVQDADGNLLASTQRVAWLELPLGLTRAPSGRSTEHLFKAKGIPIDRVQAFFGARLVAASTRREGKDGVVMIRGVPPSGAEPKQSTIDVSVLRGAGPDEVLVYLYERPYAEPRSAFTDADARALLKQQIKRAE